MNFLSTRGGAPAASFSDVLLAGLAPDGGLYLPQNWPQVDAAAFKGARYQDAAFTILSKFMAGSFSDAELREAVEAAYSDFDAPEIAPLSDLGNGQYLLELFHGPTLAFKDIALQVLGQLFSRALAKRGGRQRRYRIGGHRGAGRVAQHRRLRDASERPRQRCATPPDDDQHTRQCP
jgi:threonine synthase